MKTGTGIRYLLAYTVAALLTCSCKSSKLVRNDMLSTRADLFYQLDSPVYTGEVSKDVYLNFIDYSNMDYYTTVKRKGFHVIPLFFYNRTCSKFEASLGERSLTMNYREFLTDALLAECNSSTSLNLIDNQRSIAPDSAYVLDVKVIRNKTKATISFRETAVFTGYLDLLLGTEEGEEIIGMFWVGVSNKVKPAVTDLALKVTLTHCGNPVFDKEFSVKRGFRSIRGLGDDYVANMACLNLMAESLSLATKEIVEEISKELDLILANIKEN